MPLDVGATPHVEVQGFLEVVHVVLADVGQYHAFAQQRLHADCISAMVKDVKTSLHTVRNQHKQYADARRSVLEFQEGDQVMLKIKWKNLKLQLWPARKLFPLRLQKKLMLIGSFPLNHALGVNIHSFRYIAQRLS